MSTSGGFLFETMKMAGETASNVGSEMRRGLDLNPESTEIAELLFMTLLERHDYASARDVAAHFDGTKSSTISLAIMRGDRALINEDFESALQEFEQGVQLVDDYSDPGAVYRLACCFLPFRQSFEGSEHRISSADAWVHGITLLRRLIDGRASDPMVHVTLALELEDSAPDEARSILDAARKRFRMPREFDERVDELRHLNRQL